MTPPEMTSASLLLWIVLGISLQISLWLAISFWRHWGEYQVLRTGVGSDGRVAVPVKETLPSASDGPWSRNVPFQHWLIGSSSGNAQTIERICMG